jgi:hypothetical protein
MELNCAGRSNLLCHSLASSNKMNNTTRSVMKFSMHLHPQCTQHDKKVQSVAYVTQSELNNIWNMMIL